MGLWQTLSGRRPGLRRVSPERARLVARSSTRERLSQSGEKLGIAVLFGCLLAVVIGGGLKLGWSGWAGLACLLVLGQFFFLRYQLEYRRRAFDSLSRDVVLAMSTLLALALMRTLLSVAPQDLALFPLSLFGLVFALAWGRGFAIESLAFISACFGLHVVLAEGAMPDAARGPAFAGLMISTGGAMAAAILSSYVRRRSTLVRIGFCVGLVQMGLGAGWILIAKSRGFTILPWESLAWLGLSGLAVGLVVTGLLPAIEKLFETTTDISLLELGNTQEQPLLRKLLLEAPGTFHHSYIVGLISESAAEAVGANPLLARVGSLYHDIGKLNKPDYFAENSPEARVRHKNLTPEMSNLVISSHTRDGVELGAYHGLPQMLLDFMTEHHGTSCMEYFFHQAQNLRGAENVSEQSFRYPGPRPQRIETAIVMIADAIEAISRQMPDPTHERLRAMVHEVAIKRLMDHQFDDCGMTLKELTKIEEACTQVLAGIYHTRPTFPKGKPHPLDLSQPREDRMAASEDDQVSPPKRAAAGGNLS